MIPFKNLVSNVEMTDTVIIWLMKLYQEAWDYAVEKKDLVADFHLAFYDMIPFENLVMMECNFETRHTNILSLIYKGREIRATPKTQKTGAPSASKKQQPKSSVQL